MKQGLRKFTIEPPFVEAYFAAMPQAIWHSPALDIVGLCKFYESLIREEKSEFDNCLQF
jgi:hypothetical protein